MPRTALLFLIAAIAICGLPPLNGFVSEFLIFGGLYNWLYSADLLSLLAIVFSIGGLVLIGGLALLCFTKAFSIVFLGTQRDESISEMHETGFWQLFPMFMIASLMVLIGLFPSIFINALQRPVNLFTHHIVFNLDLIRVGAIDSLRVINWLFLAFIGFIVLLLLFRKFISGKRIIESGPTWGCAYNAPGTSFQYTASSFVKSYAKLAKPLLDIEKQEHELKEVFPPEKHYKTESYDRIERSLIDKPLNLLNRITDLFLFLQNGHLQRYILYGIIFITAVITLPLIFDKLMTLLHFLNNL